MFGHQIPINAKARRNLLPSLKRPAAFSQNHSGFNWEGGLATQPEIYFSRLNVSGSGRWARPALSFGFVLFVCFCNSWIAFLFRFLPPAFNRTRAHPSSPRTDSTVYAPSFVSFHLSTKAIPAR